MKSDRAKTNKYKQMTDGAGPGLQRPEEPIQVSMRWISNTGKFGVSLKDH